MRFKKTILSLLVGASLVTAGGVATAVTNVNKADAATASVSYTNVNIAKVHGVSANNQLFLTFITKDSGSDVPLKSWLTGGSTDDSSTRLKNFAKQIKFFDSETGETYNFASAGLITTQGTTAGDAGDANINFQKVDATGAVIPFAEGDALTFPQGMVYETDTNGDLVVDTVWKFASTLTVEYTGAGVACANTFGCIGQGNTGNNCCNVTGGFHVYQETQANSYDIIAASYYGGASDPTAIAMQLSNNVTLSKSTVDLGYGVGTGAWYRTDAALLEKILINGSPASNSSTTWLAAMNLVDGLYLGSDSSGGLNMKSGNTIVIPQDVTFTTSGGVTFTTMAKFTWTYTGTAGNPYDVTVQYINNTIPARVGVEPDKTFGGDNSSDDSSSDSSGGSSGDSSSDSSSDSSGGDTPQANRLLANFNAEDTQVFRDDAYYNQTVNKDTSANGYWYVDTHKTTGVQTKRPGTSWDVDYKSTVTFYKEPYDNKGEAYPWYINNTYTIGGTFVTAANAPADSDGNGAYKFSWGKTPGAWYPSIMFGFPNTVDYNADDELEFTLYLSESMDSNYTLWVTNALTKNVWDAEKKFTGSLLGKGQWITISMPIKDFLRADGTVAPMAFTFVYADMSNAWNTAGDNDDGDNTNDGIPAAEIYFDKVEVKTVVKTLASDYRQEDLSDIVPITETMTFTGECTTDISTFDFTKDTNIKFVRTDITTESVKMKLTINDLSAFDLYFVLNGTGKYYDQGGAFYWISNEGFNVGYFGKAFAKTPLNSTISAGVAFELELRAIPYYVEGFKSGYHVSMYVNGTEACEGGYISFADCSFGTYFGYYMHTSKTNITTTVSPVNQATTCPTTVSVSAVPATDWLDFYDFTQLKATVKGNIYGSQDPVIEIVDGTNLAEITKDADGYWIDAFEESGIVTIKATVTNLFGTFESEPLYIAIGDAELPSDSSEDSSSEEVSSEDSSSEDSSSEEVSSEDSSSEDSSSEEVSSEDSSSEEVSSEDSSSEESSSEEVSSEEVSSEEVSSEEVSSEEVSSEEVSSEEVSSEEVSSEEASLEEASSEEPASSEEASTEEPVSSEEPTESSSYENVGTCACGSSIGVGVVALVGAMMVAGIAVRKNKED